MQNKTYTSYANIKKFFKRNNVLKATFRLSTTPTTYIPITDIFISHDTWSKEKYFSLHFDTLDQVTNPTSTFGWYNLINMLKSLEYTGHGIYDHIKHHKLLSDQIGVDYLRMSLKLPVHMVRYDFRMCKHQFYIAKFITYNNDTVFVLCSPSLDSSWLTRFSLQMTKLSDNNLYDILMLVNLHLSNHIHAVILHNHLIDNRDYMTPSQFYYSPVSKIITISNPFTTLHISLVSHMKMYLQQYINTDPMLGIKYPDKNSPIILFTFTPIKNNHIFRKLII